ncbi:MAG: helix-turn-helix transcriptional regulator [Myxococcales bacterium]|nr:helix-turn-helix transcriptional regulator [Myxococcales bacterium]MCB9526259.1 helix-turn-helix transcriptional regulator [Myxococcales bacterium]
MSLAKHRELAVLAVVRAHPGHGYAVADALDGALGPALGLKRPTVYATLSRLLDRGWLQGDAVKDSARPERQELRLTDAGEAGYQALLRTCLKAATGTLTPLAVVLAGVDELPPAARRSALARLLADRIRQVRHWAAFPEHPGSAGAALRLLRMTAELERDTLAALLAD